MNSEVKEALSGIKSAWKNMLTAKDKETYNFWSEEQLRLQKMLYDERKRTLQRLWRSEINKDSKKRAQLQRYQHEYYLKVTKQKRAERRNNEAQE